MSKICKKCDTLITFGDNNYCELCANILVADLEAKLAEKDKAIENWHTMYESIMKSCHNGIEEDKSLREQLAEKEKEIEDVKKWWAYQYEGNAERKNQDKISFCIERLEEVKEYNSKLIYGDEKLNKFIDNKIKQLTHQHEDKG